MSGSGSGDSTAGGKPPFLAFVTATPDIDTLKGFASSQQWPDGGVKQGDIKTATAYLKDNPSPALLVVELPSATEAPALLDALADVCDPDTKVITVGSVNEYSFYCWLMEIGIFSYLLKPLTVQMLENTYKKTQAPPSGIAKQEKPPATLIAVMGTRGGVGATTVAVNLAGILAVQTKKNVALADIDPQEGSVSLSLDIEPSRGLRDALEKPDRIDSLFIERVMNKPLRNLAVLSAEESLQDKLNIHDSAADVLIRELREKFDIVVLDVPRYLNHFSRQCLKQADHVVLATELSLLSLRDALRLNDLIRDSLKIKQPPVLVASRVGLAPKMELQQGDFEKGIGGKVAHKIPFAPEVYMQVSSDIPAVKQKNHAAVKPLYQLAEQLVPEAKEAEGVKEKKTLSFLKKKN